MSAATNRVDSVSPYGLGAIPATIKLNLAASLLPYRFWLMGRNASGVGVAITAIPNLIPVGAAEQDTPTPGGASDLDADVVCRGQWFSGYANSALTGSDTFADTDFGKVAFGVDNQTIGKLSNYSGANRSPVGIFVGLGNASDGSPTRLWTGVAAWFAARTAMIADNANGASLSKVIDAGATTDTVNGLAEAVMPRAKHHGTVTAIELTIEGTTLAASGVTNYSTLNVFKRDGAGGAAVLIGTLDTKTNVCTQWTTVSGVVSVVAGAADLLETDIVTVTKTHGGTGAIIPAGNLRLVLKVG